MSERSERTGAGGITRRAVIAGVGAAGVTRGCGADPAPVVPPLDAPPFDPQSWDSVRAQFGLATDRAQLAAFVFASHPTSVRAAIDRHRAGLDADPTGYLGAEEGRLDTAVAAAAAKYLQTSADQIAFTESTTMGLGLLYSGLRLRSGDEVLTTEHDFYSTHEALRLRAVRDGVTVRRVRLYDDPARATVADIVARLATAVTARTRVVAVTWVHSSTGVKLPIRAIADALQNRALLCVDGVHGFGAENATPAELGCDFLVSGCHKWLFGPRGTGLVWGSPAGWAEYTPVIPPFEGRAFNAWLGFAAGPTPPGPAATPGGYHSFEHRWALAEAFAFHEAIGRARVAARTRELASRLKAGLGARVVTPMDPALSAGIVCMDGVGRQDVLGRLRARGVIASTTPYSPSYLRFGASIVTSATDVDRTVAAVKEL